MLNVLDERRLAAVAAARARAREVAWAQRAEATGRAFGRSRVAGGPGLEVLVIDLDAHVLVFAQSLLLHDTALARVEPKTLRYRLLHVPARFTRGQRRRWLRLDRTWHWAHQLAAAFARLQTLPVPTG